MSTPVTSLPAPMPNPQPARVYAKAAACLLLGLAMGYAARVWQSPASPAVPAAAVPAASLPGPATNAATPAGMGAMPAAAAASVPHPPVPGHPGSGGQPASLAQMRQAADQQAKPLLERLKASPGDSSLLAQIGAIYHTHHQFGEAAAWYRKAVEASPKDVALRTKLASSLYRDGQADQAIAQLNQGLSYDPKDANSLFDLGIIKLQGKKDGKGAVAAWQELLRTNPQLSAERKATVQKLMAGALTSLSDQSGIGGPSGHDANK